jgi:hypothetical protein
MDKKRKGESEMTCKKRVSKECCGLFTDDGVQTRRCNPLICQDYEKETERAKK